LKINLRKAVQSTVEILKGTYADILYRTNAGGGFFQED